MYQLFDSEKEAEQTSYIMQFLWRDLTSSYDIVRPYYTSSDIFSAKSIHVCILETMHLFQVIARVHEVLAPLKCVLIIR